MLQPNNIAVVLENEYPSLLKRVASAFVDGLVAFTLVGILMVAANQLNQNNTSWKIAAIILGLSYEPLMYAFGRTIGQMLFRIKVVAIHSGKKVNLVAAYLRFVCKTLLGWLSFVVMFSNIHRRAIHDFIGGTVVVNK